MKEKEGITTNKTKSSPNFYNIFKNAFFFTAESSLQQKGLACKGDQMFRKNPNTPLKKRNGRKSNENVDT